MCRQKDVEENFLVFCSKQLNKYELTKNSKIFRFYGYILFAILFLTEKNLTAQIIECRTPFITEIAFGTQTIGSETIINNSIEVFNPADFDIDLSEYKISLKDSSGEGLDISLSGIVPSHGTHVISNVNAGVNIITVSDALDALMSFEGKVSVNLVSPTNEVIDKFGKQTSTTSTFVINISDLLSDPDGYLNDLDITLGALENLLVRRKSTVQEGKTEFVNEDLLAEWEIYPNYLTQDLGEHKSACVEPILTWRTVSGEPMSTITPEIITPESAGEVLEAIIEIIGDFDDPSDVFTVLAYNEYAFFDGTIPEAIEQTEEIPGVNVADYFYNFNGQTVDLTAGNPSQTITLCTIYPDLMLEGDEADGFWLEPQNGSPAIDLGPDFVFDILIVEDEATSVNETNKLDNQVGVYPLLVEDVINIDTYNSDILIEGIVIIGANGQVVYRKMDDFNERNIVDLSSIQSTGYFVLLINTSRGMVTKRIIKS